MNSIFDSKEANYRIYNRENVAVGTCNSLEEAKHLYGKIAFYRLAYKSNANYFYKIIPGSKLDIETNKKAYKEFYKEEFCPQDNKAFWVVTATDPITNRVMVSLFRSEKYIKSHIKYLLNIGVDEYTIYVQIRNVLLPLEN